MITLKDLKKLDESGMTDAELVEACVATSISLRHANLYAANLTRANLTGTTLVRATLTRAIGIETFTGGTRRNELNIAWWDGNETQFICGCWRGNWDDLQEVVPTLELSVDEKAYLLQGAKIATQRLKAQYE